MKTLRDIKVRLLESKFKKEYRGTSAKKSREVPEKDWAEVVDLHTAITTRYGTDAHLQAMQVPGFTDEGARFPRVGRTYVNTVWREDDLPTDALPYYEVVILDLDHGDKANTAWPDRDGSRAMDVAFAALIARLRAEHGFAFYFSRTGARLIGLLDEPIPVSCYEDYMARFMMELDRAGYPVFTPDEHGHHIDAACVDLGRLFKLPLVPGSEPDSLPVWFEPSFTRTVGFDPGALQAWSFSKRGGGGNSRPTTPPPAAPRTYTRTDLKELRSMDFYETLTRPEPIAAPGERHSTILRVMGAVARRMNITRPEDLYGILYPSVRAALTPSDRPDDVHNHVWTLAHYVTSCVEADHEVDAEVRRARADAKNDALSIIGKMCGDGTRCLSAPAANQRIALATNSGIYFPFDEDLGTYSPTPYKISQLAAAFMKHAPNLVTLEREKGGFVDDRTLALKHTSADISEIRYTYAAEGVKVDLPNRRLYLPTVSVDPSLKPVFNPFVAKWLAALGGKHHESLLDWLVRVPQLDKPLCALYLQGEKGIGKNLFAQGVAKLFNASTVDYSVLGDRFQAPLLRSPVIFADESVQLSHFRAHQGTSIFRSLIGSGSHQIEQKGLDQVHLDGFIRVIVGANNSDALRIREDLSSDDVAAIQERVGYIKVQGGAARDLLQSVAWDVREEMINIHFPQHILHLAATRKLTTDQQLSRFGSWDSDFGQTVKLDIGRTRVVGEVIGRWFEQLTAHYDPAQGLFIKDDVLYVKSTALGRKWRSIVDDAADRAPTVKALATSFRALAPEGSPDGSSTVRIDGSAPVRAWPIDPIKIAAILDGTDANVEAFRAAFELEPEAESAPAVPQPAPQPAPKTAPTAPQPAPKTAAPQTAAPGAPQPAPTAPAPGAPGAPPPAPKLTVEPVVWTAAELLEFS